MKYYELDQEEKNILNDFDNNVLQGSAGLKLAKSKYEQYAKATLNKSRNLNIRLSEKDLQKIKIKALDKGIPYQTLVTSVIHRYVNDKVRMEL